MKNAMDKLCVNTVSIGQGSFQEKVKALSKAGIKYISLWYDDVKDEDPAQIKTLFAEADLTPVGLTFLGPFNQENEELYKKARTEDERKIELASALGIDTMLALTGARNGLTDAEARELLKKSLRILAPMCQKKGIKIAFEAIHFMYQDEWTYISTFEEAFNIVSDINMDNLGLMLDVYHVWMEPEILKKIENSDGKIFGFQLSDWRPINRSKTDRVLPGEGCIPLNEIIHSAEKAGWDAWYDIEIFSDELWTLPADKFIERCKIAYNSL